MLLSLWTFLKPVYQWKGCSMICISQFTINPPTVWPLILNNRWTLLACNMISCDKCVSQFTVNPPTFQPLVLNGNLQYDVILWMPLHSHDSTQATLLLSDHSSQPTVILNDRQTMPACHACSYDIGVNAHNTCKELVLHGLSAPSHTTHEVMFANHWSIYWKFYLLEGFDESGIGLSQHL